MTTTTTAPRAAKVRSLRFDADEQMLVLTVGGVGTAFALFEMPCLAGRMFRLGRADMTEKYTIAVVGAESACNCKSALYRKTCRHQDAIRVLLSRGLLGNAPAAE